MKKLLLLFVFVAEMIVAQNYNPINVGRDAWFEYNSQYGFKILPVRIDSVRTTGNDIAYYNYKIVDLNNINGNCIERKDTNFFMDKMLLQQNGNQFFFNRNNDSILLKSFSGINSSWTLFRYQNGDFIEATVSSIINQTIFGNPDSVKIITLQAKNITNNPISNIFNGKEIRIAKNNGITHFYNTLVFPTDTFSFNLIGKSNPLEGVTNLTESQIYNWSIGDEFQYSGAYNAAPTSSMNKYEQFVIIGKTISANNDTIVYSKDHVYYRKDYQYSPTFSTTTSSYHDTVSQTVIISAPALLDYYSYKSIENVNSTYGYLYQFNDNQYFGRMKKTLDPAFSYSSFDSCLNRVIGWCIYGVFTYAEGIGLASQVDGGTTCYNNQLVYYKKGNEVWGTPLDWSTIMSVNSNSALTPFITIFPNPAQDYFTILINEIGLFKLQVFDLNGRLVLNQNIDSNANVDATSLNDGIYNLAIKTSNDVINKKLVIMRR